MAPARRTGAVTGGSASLRPLLWLQLLPSRLQTSVEPSAKYSHCTVLSVFHSVSFTIPPPLTCQLDVGPLRPRLHREPVQPLSCSPDSAPSSGATQAGSVVNPDPPSSSPPCHVSVRQILVFTRFVPVSLFSSKQSLAFFLSLHPRVLPAPFPLLLPLAPLAPFHLSHAFLAPLFLFALISEPPLLKFFSPSLLFSPLFFLFCSTFSPFAFLCCLVIYSKFAFSLLPYSSLPFSSSFLVLVLGHLSLLFSLFLWPLSLSQLLFDTICRFHDGAGVTPPFSHQPQYLFLFFAVLSILALPLFFCCLFFFFFRV